MFLAFFFSSSVAAAGLALTLRTMSCAAVPAAKMTKDHHEYQVSARDPPPSIRRPPIHATLLAAITPSRGKERGRCTGGENERGEVKRVCHGHLPFNWLCLIHAPVVGSSTSLLAEAFHVEGTQAHGDRATQKTV
jgi:hypothetical protein